MVRITMEDGGIIDIEYVSVYFSGPPYPFDSLFQEAGNTSGRSVGHHDKASFAAFDDGTHSHLKKPDRTFEVIVSEIDPLGASCAA